MNKFFGWAIIGGGSAIVVAVLILVISLAPSERFLIDGSYETERAMEIGVSQSYSPGVVVICETEEFRIEEFCPNFFRVIGKKFRINGEYLGYQTIGFEQSLASGTAELTKTRDIIFISSVEATMNSGSITKEKYFITTPRNASANYNHSGNNS